MAKSNLKLSILILSIPSRLHFLQPLVEKLERQIADREDVEILSILDNKSFGISEKRNHLLGLARGDYLSWIDDDDDVSDDYIEKILKAIESTNDSDVISFDQLCFLEGIEARVFAKMGNPHEPVVMDHSTGKYKDTLRPPYHWCVWKSSLAKSEEFRSNANRQGSDHGEDLDWLLRLYPKVTKSIYLEGQVLHIYRYSSQISESL
jgi:glycosyltransferase involved in cell wall biosynthesis